MFNYTNIPKEHEIYVAYTRQAWSQAWTDALAFVRSSGHAIMQSLSMGVIFCLGVLGFCFVTPWRV